MLALSFMLNISVIAYVEIFVKVSSSKKFTNLALNSFKFYADFWFGLFA